MDLRRLTYDRFLNVIYRSMLDRLKIDHENPDRARHDLDRELNVGQWRLPGVKIEKQVVAATDRRVPHWWHGDEDASQLFMSAMGVNLRG